MMGRGSRIVVGRVGRVSRSRLKKVRMRVVMWVLLGSRRARRVVLCSKRSRTSVKTNDQDWCSWTTCHS